jgi:hypothetical protein
MRNVFIEPRPKGRKAGEPIEDYVVEDQDNAVLANGQSDAVLWAMREGHHPLVARVRHLNDKKNPDNWRSA